MNFQRMNLAALLISEPPVYSGKKRSSGTCNFVGVGLSCFQRTNGAGTHLRQLVLEDVDFIKEQDNGRSQEPPRVYD